MCPDCKRRAGCRCGPSPEEWQMMIRNSSGRLGRLFVLPLGVILCAAPGRAAGDKPPAVAATTAARLLENAVVFRAIAATNLEKAAEQFGGTKPLACVLKTDAWRKVPEIWESFFNGAFVICGNAKSPQPVFGFYNPVFDGVLLTQWQAGADPKQGCVITAAAFAKGSDLRGVSALTTNTAPAAWINNPRTPPRALAQALQKFIADFEANYPPAGKAEATLTTTPAAATHLMVMARHAAVNAGLLAMLHEKKHRDVGDRIWSFFTYLANGDRGRLAERIPVDNPLPVDKILEIPPEVRKSFVAEYTAVTDNTCLIFMASPIFPQYLGILDLAGDANGWRIRSFGFYDLASLK